jgi:hypothetical protein
MRTYVTTTGMLFGLIVLAHLWRAVKEGAPVATDPFFVALTIVAAGLCLWAWRLLVRESRRRP